MFLTPDSFLHGDFARVPKTFLTAAPTPAKPEGTESGPRLSRVRPEDERGFELPGDDALRAEGWAKGRIDQGQVLVCEVSSDAAAKMMKSALATHNRDCSHGRELRAAPIQMKRFAKSPLQCIEGGLRYVPPCREFRAAGGHVRDARQVSHLQHRGQDLGVLQGRQVPFHLAVPGAECGVFPTERANHRCHCACAAAASPRLVLQLSTTAAQVRMEVSCVSAQDPAAPRPPPG